MGTPAHTVAGYASKGCGVPDDMYKVDNVPLVGRLCQIRCGIKTPPINSWVRSSSGLNACEDGTRGELPPQDTVKYAAGYRRYRWDLLHSSTPFDRAFL